MASAAGVKLQLVPTTVALPSKVAPLKTRTLEPASLLPVSTGSVSLVTLPLVSAPVTGDTSSVTANNTAVGATWSSV